MARIGRVFVKSELCRWRPQCIQFVQENGDPQWAFFRLVASFLRDADDDITLIYERFDTPDGSFPL
jgi:hypothetical protein